MCQWMWPERKKGFGRKCIGGKCRNEFYCQSREYLLDVQKCGFKNGTRQNVASCFSDLKCINYCDKMKNLCYENRTIASACRTSHDRESRICSEQMKTFIYPDSKKYNGAVCESKEECKNVCDVERKLCHGQTLIGSNRRTNFYCKNLNCLNATKSCGLK